ncbi:hypothetical protein V1J52_12690 [Streptomyces sp. TRM 70351]|uniref:hypothetical protein n=1 Tax=Streptomyces sp. TRM 70351 TaxID=3116552 RepID=UPI002E7B286B|nr:hypothetical protein [Streptomyces sp. TRM 70351]MEE1929025.1 hypothetical protein [Streptomyces sp. TRM 70351]
MIPQTVMPRLTALLLAGSAALGVHLAASGQGPAGAPGTVTVVDSAAPDDSWGWD